MTTLQAKTGPRADKSRRHNWNAMLLGCLLAPFGALAGERAAQPAGHEQAASVPRHSTAVRIYVDPETGRRTTRPSEAARRAAAVAAAGRPEFSQSSDGLVERPAPGGGVIVDLQGRFQSSSQVRIDAQGRRELFCNDPLHGAAAHAHGTPAAGPDER